MANKATVSSLDPGVDIEFHLEGVALFSPNDRCYGMALSEIISQVAPQVTEYGETVEMAPHEDCVPQAINGGPEEHILLLEKSVWLIDCECSLQDSLFHDFKHLIRTFPKSGNAIIWIDEKVHSPTNEEIKKVKTLSKKPAVVQSKSRLIDKLADYIEYAANPYNGCGSIVDWQNEVNRLQRTIG